MAPDTPAELKETITTLGQNTLVSKVPSDNRIQLLFDLPHLLNAEKALSTFYSPDSQNTQDRLQKLREFENRGNSLDSELFDFCILDHVPSPNTGIVRWAVYRMGYGCYFFSNDDVVLAEDSEMKQEESFVAPWRRVIVCKGLSAVTSAGTSIELTLMLMPPAPSTSPSTKSSSTGSVLQKGNFEKLAPFTNTLACRGFAAAQSPHLS
ncbi:hypothetical protein PENSUB_3016 [Penicillium subrubescens]|uniref:Uncharacterized protein n=1 Tax=Penicillium subrubescens TaxID=1316194 RepID=A0A1Q5UGC7_9EURO|nr:hypothetical protein PENSUB_3016 [Penicillium subrubescens]